MYSFIKEQDMFGHQVGLNFNKQGDHHKTKIGGFFSIFVRMGLSVYIFLMCKKLITSGGDMLEVSQFLAAKDPDYDPSVKFEDT